MLFVGFGLKEVFIECGLSATASFFIVTGIYLLLLFILIACRKVFIRKFSSSIIEVLTQNEIKDGEDGD
jgi:hypothetical protein